MDMIIELIVRLYRDTPLPYQCRDGVKTYSKLFLFCEVLEGGPIMEGQRHVVYTPDHHNPHVWDAYDTVMAQAARLKGGPMHEGEVLRLECVLGHDNVAGRDITRLFATKVEPMPVDTLKEEAFDTPQHGLADDTAAFLNGP
jgi:hypothetical protein